MNRNPHMSNTDRQILSLTVLAGCVIAALVLMVSAAAISKVGGLHRHHPAVMTPAISALALLGIALVAAVVGAVSARGADREASARFAEEPALAHWSSSRPVGRADDADRLVRKLGR